MKQTAVEWLEKKLDDALSDTDYLTWKLVCEDLKEAKEMEKQQQGYSEEDMQEYVEFCIECLNQGLPPIIAKDWFNLYKNK